MKKNSLKIKMKMDSFNIIVITQQSLAHASHRYCPVRKDYSYLVNRATRGISGQGVGSHQAAG